MNVICNIKGNRVSCVIAIIDSNLHDILIKYDNSDYYYKQNQACCSKNLKKKSHTICLL